MILSRKPPDWTGFFAALKGAEVPADLLDQKERDQVIASRDPFEGWPE